MAAKPADPLAFAASLLTPATASQLVAFCTGMSATPFRVYAPLAFGAGVATALYVGVRPDADADRVGVAMTCIVSAYCLGRYAPTRRQLAIGVAGGALAVGLGYGARVLIDKARGSS